LYYFSHDSHIGKGVKISVIDSGVAYNHEELAANIWINPGELPDHFDIDEDGIKGEALGRP